jgi:hypothetical protein
MPVLAEAEAPHVYPERREARRMIPGSLTPCLLRAEGASGKCTGWVHNLSVQGLGLLTEQDYPAGTVLQVLLINAGHTFAVAVETVVVRSYPIYNGDYYVGCQFRETLRYDQILPFLV